MRRQKVKTSTGKVLIGRVAIVHVLVCRGKVRTGTCGNDRQFLANAAVPVWRQNMVTSTSVASKKHRIGTDVLVCRGKVRTSTCGIGR